MPYPVKLIPSEESLTEGVDRDPAYYINRYFGEQDSVEVAPSWAELFCGALAIDDAARTTGRQVSSLGIQLLSEGQVTLEQLREYLIPIGSDDIGSASIKE